MIKSITFLTGMTMILFAVTNPTRFLLYCALVVNIPTIVPLYLLKFAIQRVQVYNARHLEQNRYTIWLKLALSLQFRLIRLDNYLTNSIVWFLGSRGKDMIKVSKGKSSVEYTLVDEREEGTDRPASVTMRRLSKERLAQIRDGLIGLNSKGTVTKIRSNTVRLTIVRESITGLQNFEVEGKPIAFDPSKRNDLYELLPREVTDELEERFGDGNLDYEAAEVRIAEAKAKADAEEAAEASAAVAEADDEAEEAAAAA